MQSNRTSNMVTALSNYARDKETHTRTGIH